jgi:hypothetical protein
MDYFHNVQEEVIAKGILFARLSVRPSALLIPVPLDRFSWNFVLEVHARIRMATLFFINNI